MGAGIGALAASAGVPVVLLDIPAKEGDPNTPARKGLERQLKARPQLFEDVSDFGVQLPHASLGEMLVSDFKKIVSI